MVFSQDPGRVSWTRIDLTTLISDAYDVRRDQITGPDWLGGRDSYAVSAKFPSGGTRSQYPQMMASLLAERFGLVIHRITKDVTGYELIIAPGGTKQLTPANDETATDAPPTAPGRGAFERPKPDANGFPVIRSGMRWGSFFDNGMRKTTFRQCDMAVLAAHLRSVLSTSASGETVPVTDQTGISGKFDFHLEVPAPGRRLPGQVGLQTGQDVGAGDPDVGPRDISAALEKQLGLKLKALKTKLDFIVVDHVNKVPTDN